MRVMVDEITEDYERVYEADVETYTDYYKLGGFELFDVVMVEWDGQEISIFLDDEGLLKSGNIGRTVVGYPQPLFGTLIIAGGVDEEGNTLPLPKEFNAMNIARYINEPQYITK